MRKDIEKIFSFLHAPEAPEGLLDKIMERIRREKHILAVKRRLVVISLGFLASLTAIIPVFNLVRADLSQSGFLQFLSLAFSDFGTVAVYWKTFAMSLLESVPAMSIAVFLGVILALLALLKLLVRDVKIVYG